MKPDPSRKIFSVVALLLSYKDPVGGAPCVPIYLAVSRRHKPEDIGLPGGKVEFDETPEQAIIREIKEEVGVDVKEEELVAVYDRLDSPTETEKVARCFIVMQWEGSPRAMEEGVSVSWATVEDLIDPKNTFAHYNRGLFTFLKQIDED